MSLFDGPYDFGYNGYNVDPYTGHRRRSRLPHGFIEEQSTASIPGLRDIVPPASVVKDKAAVKYPLTTAGRRFRPE